MSRPRTTICVVTTRMNSDRDNPWLSDDLVAELLAQGAEVDVDVIDVETAHKVRRTEFMGARVFSHGPRSPSTSRLPRVFLRLIYGLRAAVSIRRRMRKGSYDVVVYFGPAFLMMGTPGWMRRTAKCRRLVHILWDFFPVHQVEIGRIPPGHRTSCSADSR